MRTELQKLIAETKWLRKITGCTVNQAARSVQCEVGFDENTYYEITDAITTEIVDEYYGDNDKDNG
jgi:hypothetical protein